jgi:hypothetical protein
MRWGKGRGRRSPPGGTLRCGQWGAGLPLTISYDPFLRALVA